MAALAGNPTAGPLPVLSLERETQLTEALGRQRLLSTVGALLVRRGSEDDLPALAPAVERAVALARRRALWFHGITRRATEALSERGVGVLALKGTTLSSTVYADLGARDPGDIDLLVRREDLEPATTILRELGWSTPMPTSRIPRLHRELFHPELPMIDLHWRVHWYEERLTDDLLARAETEPGGSPRLSRDDTLIALLLFLARGGFAGLRLTADIAAWWGRYGSPATAGQTARAGASYPELARALTAAARVAERRLGIPRGTVMRAPRPLEARQRAAIALSDPWLAREPQQRAAEVSLIDGLLAPDGGTRAFMRRQLMAAPGAPDRLHAVRTGARYAAAGARLAAAAFARPRAM